MIYKLFIANIFLFICLTIGNIQNTYGQSTETEKPSDFDNNKTLYRFYVEGVAFLGIVDPIGKKTTTNLGNGYYYNSNSLSFGGGIQAKIGNDWYLQKGKFTGILRLTWARLGIYNYGVITSPLHLGLGHHFQINNDISIQPFISGGAIIGTDDILYPEWDITYAIFFETKLNIKGFTIGLEYSVQSPYIKSSMLSKSFFHYIGLTIGRLFKKINTTEPK